MLTVFRKALKENCQVNITYRGQNRSETTQRKVDPYAIVHQAGWWSVVGYCHLRKDIRLFRVDRILKLNMLKQTYTIPADFDIHAYLAHQTPSHPQRLARIHFDRAAESFVRTSGILWSSIEQLPDGSLITTLSADDMHFAASLVLSFGPWAEVLEPEELRTVITEWATVSLEKHRPKSI
jgi:predicted DNA-binding transcriptional regulator YafY